MKIAIIGWLKGAPVPPTGCSGIERYTGIIATELIRQGHQVTLIAPHGSFIEGAEIIETEDMVEAANICNAINIDVVHDNTVWDLQSPIRQGIRHPHLSVTHVNHAINYSHNVVYLSKSQRTQHGIQLERNLNESPVVYCPIDPQLKPVGLPRCDYLLYLGRVIEYKGVYEAAQVAKYLDRTLIIAGPAAGAYADKIKADYPDVLFVGEVNDPYRSELIEQAYAMCCLHNNYGGWEEPGCGVVGEAMAFNTPVAIFPNGCLPELVVSWQNGWVSTTAEDMAESIKHSRYPADYAFYQQEWSAENIVHKYVNLYTQVMAGRTWS